LQRCPGITNCFLGLVLIHEDLEHRLAYWLGPTLALAIFWLLLAVALEVKKHKVCGFGTVAGRCACVCMCGPAVYS
jgi:hypothetical protein